jgi:hypothetical protein
MVVGMASSRTTEREEERRFNIRTLAIASVASATAAVVTSQLWIAGTWIAAATTPVLVALISELLHRPTERIAERFTADRPALLGDQRDEHSREAEPSAKRPPTPPAGEPPPARIPAQPGPGPIRVYRSTTPPPRRRRIAVGAVLATGALALVIAVFALTVPELIAGGAIGKDNGGTTFFSRDRDRSASDVNEKTPAGETERQRRATEQTTEDTAEEPATTEAPTEQPPPTTPTAEQPAPAESAPTPAPSEQP